MKNILRLTVALVLTTLLGAVLTGCSEDDAIHDVPCTPYATGVVIDVSVHQNVAAPNLLAGIACRVQQTIAAGLPVGIVAIDGEPWVAVTPKVFDVKADNDTKRNGLIARAFGQVISGVQALEARTGGSDVFASMMLSSDAARSANPPITDIIVIDSGASDRGVLTMTAPGMTIADPAGVAAAAVNVAGVTTDRLAGQNFTLVSFGNTVAPQPAPSESQRETLPMIWRATLEAFGATVEVDLTPRQGEGPKTALTTGTFEVIAQEVIPVTAAEPIVFDGTSALAFAPDTAELRDPEAARQALGPLADWLTESPGRTANIIGTTASPTPDLNGPLSLARAETIKQILIDHLSVPAHAISTVGAGYIASPDDHPAGYVDPGLAALNMTVRIQVISAG